MHKRIILFLLLATFVLTQAHAQKIKYKDLFVLLSAKQYAEAEPYLKKFLKDNTDYPNAYLYMGLILEDKAAHVDILRETDRYTGLLDSAVLYFGLATKGMTEKEVSKNEDYYQMYNRRDVRTGKFGVKHSDVILDLELRMKLKDRAKTTKELKAHFVATESTYRRAVKQYTRIQGRFPDLKSLYLQADDSLSRQLTALASTYDSCHIHFNDYKAIAKSMGKIGYNQDFKRWALSTADVLDKEMKPLRDKLIARDMELNKLQQQVKKDSVSVRGEVLILRGKGFPELLRIDPNPLPLQVFAMKEADLVFGSQVVENKPLRDSASLVLQVEALTKEIFYARKLDSIAGGLVERDLEAESLNYGHYVRTAYGTPSMLKTLVRSTREMALREIIHREELIKRKSAASSWIVDGADSIPLVQPVSEKSRFKPLAQVDEKYTSGLVFADSVGTGYFYLITPSRVPSLKASFPVNKGAFKKRYLSVTKSLVTQDDQGLVYFVLTFQETKMNDKYQATLAKIYKVEGLAWSVDITFDQIPVEMSFLKESSELSVKTKSSIGELFVQIFNRDGKPVK
jgi:tetratricopeptide (TPR) repeat protein